MDFEPARPELEFQALTVFDIARQIRAEANHGPGLVQPREAVAGERADPRELLERSRRIA